MKVVVFCNLPLILPDECLRGYAFRVAALNLHILGKGENLLELLSKEAGYSVTYLINQHSHLGYLRFLHLAYQGQDICTHPDLMEKYRLVSGSLPQQPPRFCPKCVVEDMSIHGISYWRRVHQLPGVDHCSMHGCSLIRAVNTSMKVSGPGSAVSAGPSISSTWQDEYFESEPIRRYVALSIAAMHSTVPVSPFVVGQVLSIRFEKVFGDSRSQSLRQIALHTLPTRWMLLHFPKIFETSHTAAASGIEDVLRPTSKWGQATKIILLAMCLLWDSPLQAIRDVQKAVSAVGM